MIRWEEIKDSVRGFTIIELFVITAILSILMLLFIPVLQKAKLKSLDAVCIGNLKQFSLAGQMYWNDNHGKTFPYRIDTIDGGDTYWFGWFERGTEGRRRFDVTRGALYRYIKDSGTQNCARLDHINDRFKLKAIGSAYGYGYNLKLGESKMGFAINSLFDPSASAFLADAAQVNTFQAPASKDNPMIEEFYYVNDREKTAHFRHNKNSFVAFCDGHVASNSFVKGSIDQRMPSHWIGRLPQNVFFLKSVSEN